MAKKVIGKIEKAELSLEIARQPVPFKEEGVMHSLRVSKQSVISFDKLAFREMEARGVRPALARMVAEELGDAIRSWISEGHAVNITGVGTLRPVVNSKAHVRPHDCSVDDVRLAKLRFYPSSEMKEMFRNAHYHIRNREEYISKWERENGEKD
jgi:hypothetical protein